MVRDRGFKSLESVESAVEKMMKRLKPLGTEIVTIYRCFGRVLAKDVVSQLDVPEFDRAAMDGYALKAEETFGASQTNPLLFKLVGKVETGEVPKIKLQSGEAVRVFTGSIIPEGANAVVMLEHSKEMNGFVQIFKSVTPFKNVIRKGEDVKKGEVILRRGEILQPQDSALLASAGIRSVEVYRKPRVAVVSTGDELLSVEEEMAPGKIYNSNAPMLCNALEELGFPAFYLGIARDKPDEIEEKLFKALEYDAVIFTGGTSVGSRDIVPEVISKHGEIVFHGVAMKPGMPTAFGIVRDKPVFMLPGTPAASFLSFYVFVAPALFRMMNVRIIERKWSRKRGILSSRMASEIGIRSLLRVNWQNGKIHPLKSGSGILSSLVKANALLSIPEDLEGYEAGEEVEVVLLRDLTEVFE
uniref:molybdopterin molybdotransferase n=1 Tax=Archaeoglobus fulgidus TaxID=2234 RepID=A0A7J2TKG0_ARCFL